MASTEKLPSGRYRGRYVDADGKKRAVPGTFGRKSDAMDAAVDEQAKAKRRAAAEKGTLSARTVWGEWWDTLNRDREFTSDRGIKEAQFVEKHVRPQWGDTPLNGIKRGEVQAWVDGLCRKGYAANTVRNIYAPLGWSINRALDAEILDASPLVNIKLPRRPKRAKKYVTPGEPASMKAGKLNQRFIDACDFILDTGLRPGEMAGLHVEDVDLVTGWAVVINVYVQRLRKIRPEPKDEDSRKVPLSNAAIAIVKRQLDGRDLSQGCGVPHTDGAEFMSPLVFRNIRGGVLHPGLLTRRMREAARELGVRPKSGYALRRGFATRAIDGGADPFAVKRIMGHADLDELSGYVQETPQARARMLAALGERPQLSAVEGVVGSRGTDRGTDSDNQASPEATNGGSADTA